MKKIDLSKLTGYLNGSSDSRVVLSFEDIEKIIDGQLPEKAKESPKWWWNSQSNFQAKAWLSVNYKTINVSKSMYSKEVVFEKYREKSNFLIKRIFLPFLLLLVILSIITPFLFNQEYNLFHGILNMLVILILVLLIVIVLLFYCWKKLNDKHKKDNKNFAIFLFGEILLALCTSGLVLLLVSYVQPLVIPNEYTVKCINFTYTGLIMNFNADGEGKLFKWNGDIIEGSFKEGKIEGEAKYIYKNGDIYQGNFVSNKMHGEGVYTFESGKVYTGKFTRGEVTGVGILNMPNNDIYKGEVKNGERSGKGILEMESGCYYKGEWSNDAKHGKGVMHFQNGDKYEGFWERGFIKSGSEVLFSYKNGETKKRHMYAFAKLVGLNENIVSIEKIDEDYESTYDEFDMYDQKTYQPNLIEDERLKYYGNDDKGVYLFQMLNTDCLNGYNEVVFFGNNAMGFGGHQYSGEFYNGTFHGKGTLFITDGNSNVIQTYQGDFVDGFRHGYGVLTSSENDRFEGNFINDEPNGYGIYYHKDGRIDEGNWNTNWKLSGYGSTTIDGTRYEGTWQYDHLTGNGHILYKDGTEKKIIWSDDGSTFKEVE